MESARPFSERLEWRVQRYGSGLFDYLTLDNKQVADATGCPRGWALRIYCIPYGRPGSDDIYSTREMAMQAGIDWFTALDIVPWDEPDIALSMAKTIRDLEHHFNIGGRVHVAQVCSPNPHSAAPVSDSRGEWETAIYTCAADDLADFDHDDPDFLAQRVVVDISTKLPNVPEAELAAFYDEVVAWICEHRRVAAEEAHED